MESLRTVMYFITDRINKGYMFIFDWLTRSFFGSFTQMMNELFRYSLDFTHLKAFDAGRSDPRSRDHQTSDSTHP